MINTKRCTISCDNFEMSLELMFFLIFGIIVIHSPKVEGQCKYLPNSTHVCMCHCHSNCRHGCQTCDLGWSGSKQLHCQKENIVYHKRTWQENTYSSKFDSSQAVDGNLQTYSRVQETEGAIWWRVRLDGDHSITRINVTMDWVPNIEYDVYVTHDSLVTNSHSLCDTEKSHSDQMRSVVFECSRAMIGSTIEIQAPPHVPLTIYEVSSVSCTVGTHGEECDILCPKECHRSCNKITGKCDQCPAGQFGDSCNLNCSKFCGKSGCDRTTGQCYQCATNLWGPNCTKYCHNACSLHCQRETGHCRVCQSGHRFNGTTCEQCPSGSYGVNCSQKCATKCKDEVCDAETGKCSDCKEWFYGTFCQNECSSNCLNSSCSATSGECLKCERGHYGTQCDPCLKGHYGEQCQEECDYCRSRDCDPVNGTCENCDNGKYGAHCTQSCFSSCKNKSCYMNGECITCEKGYYGDYCESLCQPINCELCNKTSGECLQCITGRYGSDCTGVCRAECKTGCFMNNGSCDDVSGKNAPISSHSMVNNVMILGGTALLIAFSIVFLVVICRFQKERNKTRREANYERSLSLPGQNSSHQYHSLVEEHIYQNVITEGEVEQEAEIEPVTENACAAIQDCNEFFKAEIKSDIQLPKRFMRFASLDEELLRRNRNRASELSTPYETIIIREDSSRVSYYKK